MGEKSPSPGGPASLCPPSPLHPPFPVPSGASCWSLAPNFSKSQSNDSRWLPARITSLDAEFRRLDLQDRGIWNLEGWGELNAKPGARGWGGGLGFRMGGEGTTLIEGSEFGGA